MALKTFNELRQLDITKDCDYREARDEKGNKINVPYLNWAKCIDLLHDNGANIAYFEPLTNENGSSLFMSGESFTDSKGNTNRCYEVRVRVVIDDLDFVMNAPVLNGTAIVKDETMNQLRVANAQARAFVKGVAIRTGLGFGLWSDYEAKQEIEPADRFVRFEDLQVIQKQVQELYTTKLQTVGSRDELMAKLGISFETAKAYFSYFDTLYKFSQELIRV